MATYGDIVSIDAVTGVQTRTPVDNAWIRANTRQVVLSADKVSITADGVDQAIVTAQLKTLPLLDDMTEAISEAVTLDFEVDGVLHRMVLDAQGALQFALDTKRAGTYTVQCQTINSNVLTITAV